MKKVATLLIIFFLFQCIILKAAFVSPNVLSTNNVNGYEQKIALLKKIAYMNVKEYQAFTGKHLNVIDIFVLKIEQKKLQKSFDTNGNISNKKLETYLKNYYDEDKAFHVGGLLLGLFLPLLGVLIAYLAFNDDNKRRRIRWAWIGTSISIGILTILFRLLAASA